MTRYQKAAHRRARVAARRLREVEAGGWSKPLPPPPGKPRILWHAGYWDGPTDGVCEIAGRRFWFSMLDDGGWIASGECLPRVYALHPYEGEFAAFHDHWHEEFRKYVGTHCDYDAGKRTLGAAATVEQDSDRFYGPYKLAVEPVCPPAIAKFTERDWCR